MQSAPPKITPPPKVVEFYKPSGKRAPKTPPGPGHPVPTGFWQRYRDIIQWAAPTLISLIALALTIYWHYSANPAAASDEHVEALISKRLEPMNQRLNQLTEQVNDLLEQLKRTDQETPGQPPAAKSATGNHPATRRN
ncbi:MAG: hypothetical protein WA510_00730 [Acidobacteriaceae bacterium]